MDLILQEGKLTQDQVDKYMKMLESDDEEMENLAITQLQYLRYGTTW